MKMGSKIGKGEEKILQIIDAVVTHKSAKARIDSIVLRVERKLSHDFEASLAWEPVPLPIYRNRLPKAICSSWVFVLRAQANTGSERHPNSHQRMMSYRGEGDLQLRIGPEWCSHRLTSASESPIDRRWIFIPPGIWHRAVVPKNNWVVVSFHTVPAEELIEERPDPTDAGLTLRRRYLQEK